MKIVLLGAPGVGKGTIAAMIKAKYGLTHISTGDIFRDHVKRGTEIGVKIKGYMDSGELVPDDIVMQVVEGRIKQEDCAGGYILDGFPRTVQQAEALSGMTGIDHVLNLAASEETIVRRLSSRRTCSGCNAIYNVITLPPKEEGKCDKCGGQISIRDDAKPEIIKKRLLVYDNQTKPLVDYYSRKGLLKDISAEGGPEDIFAQVRSVLEH